MGTNLRHQRYRPFPTVELPDRAWPNRTLTAAPRWLSTDLRDGNQALPRPMTPQLKLLMFELLTSMGYTEIEVGFPVASKDDHEFVRMLIEEERIPQGVRITVMTQARDEMIKQTVESLRGARRAAVHVYNATSPQFRSLVFGMNRDECKSLAVEGARMVMKYTEQRLDDCDVMFQYSPELFNETELDFAVEVCESVMDVWEPLAGREIVLNLPSTVERATPNVFADQIEWFHRNLTRREHVCLSVHPHNDRGTAVAAAELAVLAGAERIEGCLFGGGERSGNVCLVTLGLNLFTQGVDPGIDFSNLDRARRVVEHCTGIPVPARFPYCGEMVYTAYSGAHQDAIKKGFDAIRRDVERTGTSSRDLPWTVPYLPIDPEDVGRNYEAVVRINSQSGKGGVAYLLGTRYGFALPRALQVEFAGRIQEVTEGGGQLTAAQIHARFEDEYMRIDSVTAPLSAVNGPVPITLYFDETDQPDDEQAAQNEGYITTAFAHWNAYVRDTRSVEHADDGVSPRASQEVAAYAAIEMADHTTWGAGVSTDAQSAAVEAMRAAIARERRRTDPPRSAKVIRIADSVATHAAVQPRRAGPDHRIAS